MKDNIIFDTKKEKCENNYKKKKSRIHENR